MLLQVELVRCLEFGLVSKKARICVRALTVCAIEVQDIMMRQLPSVLLRLSQISATVAMAIPLMEFLSSKPIIQATFIFWNYVLLCAKHCRLYLGRSLHYLMSEIISGLIRLPQLYANFVEEQYMSVFAIALPYTNPFK